MGRKSKAKGARGEREAAAFLREHGFDEARRGVQYHGGPDSPDVVGLPGVHIEVKRVETLRLYDSLEQSKDDAADGEIPIVLHRRNGRKWVAVLDAEDFLALYKLLALYERANQR